MARAAQAEHGQLFSAIEFADKLDILRFRQPRSTPNRRGTFQRFMMRLRALKARGLLPLTLQTIRFGQLHRQDVLHALDNLLGGVGQLDELQMDGRIAPLTNALGGPVSGIHEALPLDGG